MSLLADCHMHTTFSFDADSDPGEMCRSAGCAGLRTICFTDHLDFDHPQQVHLPDFTARAQRVQQLRETYSPLEILEGAEVSLADRVCAEKATAALCSMRLDYIIGSVHTIHGEDVWADSFYAHRSREEAYRLYLETLLAALETFPTLDAMGHYDFVCHYAPYRDRAIRYADAPGLFDAIFSFLIRHGKTMEINTSAWMSDAPWGLDILTRFHELGGKFVTLGADAHSPAMVGNRLREAVELARSAHLDIAVYHDHRPQLLAI